MKAKIGKIIIVVLIVLIVLVAIFIIRNLTFDYTGEQFAAKEAKKHGIEEKQFQLADGSVIHYAEGPDNGPNLLLLHGQMMDWKDYRAVLPDLVEK